MLFLVKIILTLLINSNLHIINKKIIRIKNVINKGNLTETRLNIAKDRLSFLKLCRYGVIIRESLD